MKSSHSINKIVALLKNLNELKLKLMSHNRESSIC